MRQHAAAIVEAVGHPMLVLDGELRVRVANRAWCTLFSVTRDLVEGHSLNTITEGAWDRPELCARLEEAVSGRRGFADYEVSDTFPGAGRRCFLVRGDGMAGGERTPLAVMSLVDITSRKDTEIRRETRLDELHHRLKNVLASAHAVASQTLRTASSLENARSVLGSRLSAMARAQDLLVEENWRSADIAQVVNDAVMPHADTGERFEIGGATLHIHPRAALSLAMALHELCTNATKYGALSTASGRIHITWEAQDTVDGPRLYLTWREEGGPAVQALVEKGFGSNLIERALAMELGGKVEIEFAEEGVRCMINAPLP